MKMSSNVQIDTSNHQDLKQQSSQNSSKSGGQTNSRANLIVNYLPQSVKEHDFNQLFSKLGPIKSCKLMFDRTTGYSFGYGFVEYVNEDDAKKAIDTLNGYQIEHKRLKVAYARPNCEETKNTNLYIRNIPITYDEQQLHELFSQYGDVIQVRLLRDQNTTFSRRIGFVIMATKQMAQHAIQNLDNTIPPNGANEPIYVKYADEDGSKKRHPPGISGGQGNGTGHHRNNMHAQNQHFNNQNSYHNNYQQQNSHFNNPNSFMMGSNQQNLQNNLQNLGKMKTNRSAGHQNRYNPIGGNGQANQVSNGGLNTPNNGSNANNYNPWNLGMAAAIQQPYSNFGTPNALLGNSGFDNLISTIGGGTPGPSNNANSNSGYGHPSMHHHQMQQQQLHNSNNNYLNLNAAAAMAAAAAAAAAAAGLGNSSSTGNLLDVSGGGQGLGMDTKNPGLSYNSTGSNTIYVYGIGSHATESDLYSLFSNYGRIARVNVIKNPKTGQCKGFGFVVYESFEEANMAVHSMNGYVYHNRPLQVQLHVDS